MRAAEPGGRDRERETALRLEVLDAAPVRAERVDEGPDRALLHARIAGDDSALSRARAADERADRREEARRGARVPEIDLLPAVGHGKRTAATGDNERLAAVFPVEFGALELDERVHHHLGVVRVEEVLEAAGARAEGSEEQRAV